ncbi:hypothetical protein BTVI_145013 [Pitangus sulphuratus]|nr:hypothetical protein BTVI_145013 [Pitangus sulphuratus]
MPVSTWKDHEAKRNGMKAEDTNGDLHAIPALPWAEQPKFSLILASRESCSIPLINSVAFPGFTPNQEEHLSSEQCSLRERREASSQICNPP